MPKKSDPVNSPSYYTSHPAGIEQIEVTEHMSFNGGSAIQYIWRAEDGSKGNEIQDLEKAIWHLQREIKRRQEYDV